MKQQLFAYALVTVSTLASLGLPATAVEGSSNVRQTIDSNAPAFKPPPGRPTNPDRHRDDGGRTFNTIRTLNVLTTVDSVPIELSLVDDDALVLMK